MVSLFSKNEFMSSDVISLLKLDHQEYLQMCMKYGSKNYDLGCRGFSRLRDCQRLIEEYLMKKIIG